jgi:hypothetical protein
MEFAGHGRIFLKQRTVARCVMFEDIRRNSGFFPAGDVTRKILCVSLPNFCHAFE